MDDSYPDMISEIDQSLKGWKDICVPMMWAEFSALTEAGFTRPEALQVLIAKYFSK